MNETEFTQLAEKTLNDLEISLDGCAAECDFEKNADLLEIECADGSKIIINKHSAAKEIWLAARAGGFHFRYDGNVWRDTRDGRELFERLSDLLSLASGNPVQLKPA